MRRSLNFTNRGEIKKIQYEIIKQNEEPQKIVIESIGIGTDLYKKVTDMCKNDCLLFVEAYHGTELERFSLGNLNTKNLSYECDIEKDDTVVIKLHHECDINKLAYKDNLKLRIIIVDPKTKRILAHRDNVRVFGNESSILPTRFTDIGNKIWTIKYEGDDGEPILYINKNIPGIQYLVKTNPFLRLNIFPNVIKEILKHIFFENKIESLNSPQNEWHEKWFKFISNTLKIPLSDLSDTLTPFDNVDDINLWIENVVDKFCEDNADYFKKLLSLAEESYND